MNTFLASWQSPGISEKGLGGSSSFPSLGEGGGLDKERVKILLAIGRERADRKSVTNFILSFKITGRSSSFCACSELIKASKNTS